jgi:mannosyltransferase OCH1-like enzyme
MLIPRVFHRVWIDGTIPTTFEEYWNSWQRWHPDWAFRTWSQDTLPSLVNQDCFDSAKSPRKKADIARYELLLRYGGVYLDTDFECLRSIDAVINGIGCFAAFESPGMLNIAILGARPEHPLFARVVNAIPHSLARRPDAPISDQTGPRFFTTIARSEPGVALFDEALFYPYHWTELQRANESFPSAYAVHHWHGMH